MNALETKGTAMKKTAFAATVLLLLSAASSLRAAGPHRTGEPIPGRYLVLLSDGVARPAGAGVAEGPSVPDVARALGLRHGAAVGRTFEHAVDGFVVDTDKAGAAALARDPEVARVEPDAWVSASATQMGPPSWGLDRIDQRGAQLDQEFHYGTAAAGIRVFVVDTGIRSTHADFGGRVDTANGYSTIADGRGTEDCNGHGTAVAGIIGGATYGAAKAVLLDPVRVLDCNGQGTLSDAVAGLDWVVAAVQDHQKGKASTHWRAVINMSLEAPASLVLDRAVVQATLAGIPVVVAAGNDGGDACAASPSRVPEAITVGATDSTDQIASFSNTGSCVDVYAPGVGVASTWIRSDTDAVTLSGTSFAAPHAAAVAAMILSQLDWAGPEDVQRLIVEDSSAMATGSSGGAAAPLLYSDFMSDGVDNPPYVTFTAACRTRQRDCAFDASSSYDDQGIASYSWDFGDGTYGNRARERHGYPKGVAGPYTATLTVTDTAGQTSTYSVQIGTNWY
jgi:serine protease